MDDDPIQQKKKPYIHPALALSDDESDDEVIECSCVANLAALAGHQLVRCPSSFCHDRVAVCQIRRHLANGHPGQECPYCTRWLVDHNYDLYMHWTDNGYVCCALCPFKSNNKTLALMHFEEEHGVVPIALKRAIPSAIKPESKPRKKRTSTAKKSIFAHCNGFAKPVDKK